LLKFLDWFETKDMAESLHVVIVALGVNTVDDIRPLIALARGLIQLNDTKVSMITHQQYAEVLGEERIIFVDGGYCPFWARSNTPEGKSLEGKGKKGGDMNERLKLFMGMLTTQWFEKGKTYFEATKPDVALLASTSAMFVYPTLCEILGVKIVVTDNSPLSKTSEFGPPRGFGASQAGFRHVNLQRWGMHSKSMWNVLYQQCVNDLRSKHNLPIDEREDGPWSELVNDDNGIPVLLTYSHQLLPRPLEWPKKVIIIGPPPDLVSMNERVASSVFRNFLDGSIGKPVVFINFGTQFNSFGNRDSRVKILQNCTSEALRVGWRCVVVCPSTSGVPPDTIRGPDVQLLGGRQATPATIAALWTHCSLVLCSGDPWTIHSGLRRGVPVGVVDFGRDDTPEAFWGGRVEASGVGLTPIPIASVLDGSGVSAIGDLLNAVITPGTIAHSAKTVAGTMSAKDKAKNACMITHDILTELCFGKPKVDEPPLSKAPPSMVSSSLSAAAEVESPKMDSVQAPPPSPPQLKTQTSSTKSKDSASGGGGKEDSRPMAGFSFQHRGLTGFANPEATNVWRKGDDSLFKVRVGPNYKKLGKKAPSEPSLYELVAVDIIRSDKRMTDFSQYLRYPEPDIQTNHPGVPPLFVMNGTIPTEVQ
jgi:UDP:flavonoid glycosyltransferase YjiC (YdhE family)